MKQLSKREKQVIGLISTGETSKMIAKRLGISIRTVDAHRSHIMQKYNVKKCEHAVRVAIELGDIVLSSKSVNYLIERDKLTKDIIKAVRDFEKQSRGAKIILKEVPDPQRFGIPIFEGKRIVGIEEKPKHPRSPYAVTGIYFYDSTVFNIIQPLKPSARGELEITDVNNAYIKRGEMTWEVLDGWWTDAGTFESLLLANHLVSKTDANNVATEIIG